MKDLKVGLWGLLGLVALSLVAAGVGGFALGMFLVGIVEVSPMRVVFGLLGMLLGWLAIRECFDRAWDE